MEQFTTYLQIGLEHITDIRGYDHILFIIALCVVYFPKDVKKLLILVTAFTVGHSITLVLATLELVKVNGDLIETLIPITIMLTALFNLKPPKEVSPFHPEKQEKPYFRYVVAVAFGLIHGLGFSNYLRALLLKTQSIAMPLFAFNVGLEIGQVLVVLVLMVLCLIFVNILKMKEREWTIFISGIAFGVAASILIDKLIN